MKICYFLAVIATWGFGKGGCTADVGMPDRAESPQDGAASRWLATRTWRIRECVEGGPLPTWGVGGPGGDAQCMNTMGSEPNSGAGGGRARLAVRLMMVLATAALTLTLAPGSDGEHHRGERGGRRRRSRRKRQHWPERGRRGVWWRWYAGAAVIAGGGMQCLGRPTIDALEASDGHGCGSPSGVDGGPALPGVQKHQHGAADVLFGRGVQMDAESTSGSGISWCMHRDRTVAPDGGRAGCGLRSDHAMQTHSPPDAMCCGGCQAKSRGRLSNGSHTVHWLSYVETRSSSGGRRLQLHWNSEAVPTRGGWSVRCVLVCAPSRTCHLSGAVASNAAEPRKGKAAKVRDSGTEYDCGAVIGVEGAAAAECGETHVRRTVQPRMRRHLGKRNGTREDATVLTFLSLSTRIRAVVACHALWSLPAVWWFGHRGASCSCVSRIVCGARRVAGSRRTWPERALRASVPWRTIWITHYYNCGLWAEHPGVERFTLHIVVDTAPETAPTYLYRDNQGVRYYGCGHGCAGDGSSPPRPRVARGAQNLRPGCGQVCVNVAIECRCCHHQPTDADDDRHSANPDHDRDRHRFNLGETDSDGREDPESSLPSSLFPIRPCRCKHRPSCDLDERRRGRGAEIKRNRSSQSWKAVRSRNKEIRESGGNCHIGHAHTSDGGAGGRMTPCDLARRSSGSGDDAHGVGDTCVLLLDDDGVMLRMLTVAAMMVTGNGRVLALMVGIGSRSPRLGSPLLPLRPPPTDSLDSALRVGTREEGGLGRKSRSR